MVAGSLISIEKQEMILAHFKEGYSVKEIQKRLSVGMKTIYRILERGYVKIKNEYNKRTGRPRKLSIAKEKEIKSIVKRNKRITRKQIISKISENVSPSTIGRILKKSGLVKRKMKTKPLLKDIHKNKRATFALEYASPKYDWSKWIFSDEKKFNLDGPDGYRYYWHDLNSHDDIEIYSKDHNCRKSVMVWGAISKQGVSKLVEVKPKTKGPDYVEILKEGLIPIYDDGDLFQHDGASCHKAKITKNFLRENQIISPLWPSKSPDLNPIENIWGWISKRIYFGKPAYTDLESLKNAIFQAWDEIPDKLLDSLIDSMPKRMKEVIVNGGNPINY